MSLDKIHTIPYGKEVIKIINEIIIEFIRTKIGFLEFTGSLMYFTFFLFMNLVSGPPFVIKNELQLFSNR